MNLAAWAGVLLVWALAALAILDACTATRPRHRPRRHRRPVVRVVHVQPPPVASLPPDPQPAAPPSRREIGFGRGGDGPKGRAA